MIKDNKPTTFMEVRHAARAAVCKEIISFGDLSYAETTLHMAHDIADAALNAAGVEDLLAARAGQSGSKDK